MANFDPRGMFREDFFFKFSPYKSIKANDPWGMTNFKPRGMVGRINVGNH